MISLILSLLFNPAYASGADRCAVKDCICEVRENRVKQKKPGETYVTFAEDSSELSDFAKRKLDAYLQRVSGNFHISGYADSCGNSSHNLSLSQRRANAVRKYVGSKSKRSSIAFYGETNSHNHTEADRKAVISTRKDWMTRNMDAVKADVYLIDASGSISSHWSQITEYDFPYGSKVILSKMTNCRDGQYVNTVTPAGGTEIWYSYWTVLKEMNHGETILIISDFRSNYPLSANEHKKIEALAKSKGIKVYTIKW
jgi:hypothetical protein